MHSRGEVRSFLQSAADYWLAEVSISTALRMDAVSNLIYWQGNAARGVNKDAVLFLVQNLNQGLKGAFPDQRCWWRRIPLPVLGVTTPVCVRRSRI